jgi:hypothetical protein
MGKYLDIINRAEATRGDDKNDINDKTYRDACTDCAGRNHQSMFDRQGRFYRKFSELERRCPDHIDTADWQQAIEDGRRFLAAWGEKADALGWTARDLFGLAPVPDRPTPNYRRLSRYDLSGLCWHLRGRAVLALTESTAAIQSATGAVSVYRRHAKLALGPLGDSLKDLA